MKNAIDAIYENGLFRPLQPEAVAVASDKAGCINNGKSNPTENFCGNGIA